MRTTTLKKLRAAFIRGQGGPRRFLAWLVAVPDALSMQQSAFRQARLLERDNKVGEAAERWKAIRTAYPRNPGSYTGYAAALRRLNRLEDAHDVLAEAALRFPGHLKVRVAHAVATQALGRHAEALTEGLAIAKDFPSSPLGYECACKAHRALLQFDKAEAVLLRGRLMCPDSMALVTEYAANADEKGDWAEGLARWEDVRRAFPDAAIGPAGVGAALRRLKRYDEADRVLADAMVRFPDNSNLGINHAWIAEQRDDWPEAMRRWTALRRLFPNDDRVRAGLVECTGKASLAEADRLAEAAHLATAAPPPALAASLDGADGDDRHAELFKRFESLGENCEFGFVQRHFGADPLGLVRWAGIGFDQLIDALATGFENVGSAETTELHVNPANHEYYTTDRVYGLSMHTFIIRNEGHESAIFQKLCRRLSYLRGKLLDDLKTAEKIFVFQSGQSVTDENLLELHRSLRRYGPTTLLCVRVASDLHQAGSVMDAGDGLLIGYLDRVGFDGRYWNISFEIWLRLCEAAIAFVDGRVHAKVEKVGG